MQVWVYGDSEHPFVVAIIAPEREAILQLAKAKGLSESLTVEALCLMDEVRAEILDDMVACGKSASLRSFEVPKRLHIDTATNQLGQAFTVENDLLTPTFKLRRMNLFRRYKDDIKRLYSPPQTV
mmetsp:Transcript_4472/g.10806  ORF Transcript_4472/g.10806 Transcript_4472/m.10806 type:complete len:125 (-) Transcript_4472:99-473(-)